MNGYEGTDFKSEVIRCVEVMWEQSLDERKNTTHTKMRVKADRKDMLLRRQTSGKVAKAP